MFTTLVVQPIFNLLVAIYSVLPGHNFGLAIILFTILIRLLMWPIVKKQLHQTKAMRKLQPEIKKVKAKAKGNKQQESMMMLELYKERGINPFASIVPLIIQLPIFIGLYLGLQRIVRDPSEMVNFAYGFLQNLPSLQELATDISKFDATLFGAVDLTRAALSPEGFYLPAFVIVVSSVVVQYFQAKQLMPVDKDARGLRQILKDAGEGKQADQSEVNAAIGRSTKFLLPALIFVFTIGIASALSLYWLVSGAVAYIQQARVLNQDEEEMEAIADEPAKKKAAKKPAAKTAKKSVADIPEAEVVATNVETEKKSTPPQKTKKHKKAGKRKKRRK